MKKNADNAKKNPEGESVQPKLDDDELDDDELDAVSGGTGKNIYGIKSAKKRVAK
jgi:bacteriocin-like protein